MLAANLCDYSAFTKYQITMLSKPNTDQTIVLSILVTRISLILEAVATLLREFGGGMKDDCLKTEILGK
jgi:hypothetical protein